MLFRMKLLTRLSTRIDASADILSVTGANMI
jgi:hypothetical protein